jgi:hypothetical protein
MPDIAPDEAIAHAGAEIGLLVATPARVWRVRRLDRELAAYYLVVFGPDAAAIAVAAVDAGDGRIQTWARLPGQRPHVEIDALRATEIAGLGPSSQAELVWRPCRASQSPLYPLWEVRAVMETVYVDQQGVIWRLLDPAGPGG